ncbi:hypothetical protein JHK86_000590 [Glycine max]|nr:hypothetical protein JHK86_000590 [Glycine max]
MKSFLLWRVAIVEKNRPYVAMLFIQFVYAGMALLSKAAISKEMSPYVFVVYRQAFASVALSPFAFFDSKQSAPLSCNLLCKLLCKLFLVSLVGLTASSNLYYVSINYTTATFAAAATNTVPAITFIMAVLIRMESISVKRVHGLAKILGSVLSLAGAITFALAEKNAVEAFETAQAMGVIMFDLPNCPKKHCQLETSSVIENLQFGNTLVLLPFNIEQPLNARFLVEKGLAIEVKRNEDGSFTRNDIAASLRQAMVLEEGKKIRNNTREAAAIVGNLKLHQDHYVVAFVQFLKNGMWKPI